MSEEDDFRELLNLMSDHVCFMLPKKIRAFLEPYNHLQFLGAQRLLPTTGWMVQYTTYSVMVCEQQGVISGQPENLTDFDHDWRMKILEKPYNLTAADPHWRSLRQCTPEQWPETFLEWGDLVQIVAPHRPASKRPRSYFVLKALLFRYRRSTRPRMMAGCPWPDGCDEVYGWEVVVVPVIRDQEECERMKQRWQRLNQRQDYRDRIQPGWPIVPLDKNGFPNKSKRSIQLSPVVPIGGRILAMTYNLPGAPPNDFELIKVGTSPMPSARQTSLI